MKSARHWLLAEPLCQIIRTAQALGTTNKTLSRSIALRYPYPPRIIERHIARMLSGAISFIEWRRADAYAIALGLHPFDIWGEAWEDWGPECYAICTGCHKEFKNTSGVRKASSLCRRCSYPQLSTRESTSSE